MRLHFYVSSSSLDRGPYRVVVRASDGIVRAEWWEAEKPQVVPLNESAVTDGMVERAFWVLWEGGWTTLEEPDGPDDARNVVRAALEAALNGDGS